MRIAALLFSATLAYGQNWVKLDVKMPEPRLNAVAVRAADERIYLIGGVSESGLVQRVDIFDPSTRTWARGADLPTLRNAFAAAAGRNGLIYVFGGSIDPARVTNDVEVYDPTSNRWFGSAPMPTARCGAAAVTGRDGRIYVMGGAAAGFPGEALSTVETYDPGTGEWSVGEPLPTPRSGLAAAVTANGRIVAAGGMALADAADVPFRVTRYLDTVEIFDPATGAWHRGAPLPSPRAWTSSAFVQAKDDRMVAVGGLRTGPIGGGSGTVLLDVVDAYDVGADSWVSFPSLPEPAPGLAVAASTGNAIYVFGGHTHRGPWTSRQSNDVLQLAGLDELGRPESRSRGGTLVASARRVVNILDWTRSGLSKVLPVI